MIITYQGREYPFDETAITVDEWRELKRKYRMTPKGFEDGAENADPDAMTFLYWLLMRRDGQQQLLLGDHLKPDVIALHTALAEATSAEASDRASAAAAAAADGQQEAADPTRLSASPALSPSPPAAPSPVSAQTAPAREVTAQPTGS